MRILLKTPLEGRPALAVTAFCPGIASSEQYTDFFPPSEAHWLSLPGMHKYLLITCFISASQNKPSFTNQLQSTVIHEALASFWAGSEKAS